MVNLVPLPFLSTYFCLFLLFLCIYFLWQLFYAVNFRWCLRFFRATVAKMCSGSTIKTAEKKNQRQDANEGPTSAVSFPSVPCCLFFWPFFFWFFFGKIPSILDSFVIFVCRRPGVIISIYLCYCQATFVRHLFLIICLFLAESMLPLSLCLLPSLVHIFVLSFC